MMNTNSRTVLLQRLNKMQPWGFRLQGGCDFRIQLSVKKVNFKSQYKFLSVTLSRLHNAYQMEMTSS